MISRLLLGTEVAVGVNIDVEHNRHLIAQTRNRGE